jgi:hypothetical protein
MFKRILSVMIPATILISTGLVCAQSPVRMTVTVSGSRASEIPDLRSEDVLVFQGFQQRKVSDVTPLKGIDSSLELYILIDDSSALNSKVQLADLRDFIQNQPDATLIGVAYMHGGKAQIAQALTPDHAAAARALRMPWGNIDANASPFLGLHDLIEKWPASSIRQEVLMISSGADSFGGIGPSNSFANVVIQHVQMGGLIVHTLYAPLSGNGAFSFLIANGGQMQLVRLAEETGGACCMAGFGSMSFAPYLRDLAERLSHQYSIEFLIPATDQPELVPVRFVSEIPGITITAATRALVWPITSIGDNR